VEGTNGGIVSRLEAENGVGTWRQRLLEIPESLPYGDVVFLSGVYALHLDFPSLEIGAFEPTFKSAEYERAAFRVDFLPRRSLIEIICCHGRSKKGNEYPQGRKRENG
jgi:hypothetical protein